VLCLDGADLGNRHLEIGQNLQQVSFERFIGAIQFVDQQHCARRRLLRPAPATAGGGLENVR
jgi:hypothetical protein